jgi:tetratricopeptide (TPR) repeat protein
MVAEDGREAVRMFQQALDLRKQLVEQAPTNNWFRRNLARTYQNLAIWQEERGRPEGTLKDLEEGIRLLRQVLADEPAVTLYQSDLGWGLFNIGFRLAGAGRKKEAREAFEQSRGIFQKLRSKSPGELYARACATPKRPSPISRRT